MSSPKVTRVRTGIERIADERQRQIDAEGWTPEHDDEHTNDSLAMAAVCYAAPRRVYVRDEFAAMVAFKDPWPWDDRWDKRKYPNGSSVLGG
jgi:hypothetical protein